VHLGDDAVRLLPNAEAARPPRALVKPCGVLSNAFSASVSDQVQNVASEGGKAAVIVRSNHTTGIAA